MTLFQGSIQMLSKHGLDFPAEAFPHPIISITTASLIWAFLEVGIGALPDGSYSFADEEQQHA